MSSEIIESRRVEHIATGNRRLIVCVFQLLKGDVRRQVQVPIPIHECELLTVNGLQGMPDDQVLKFAEEWMRAQPLDPFDSPEAGLCFEVPSGLIQEWKRLGMIPDHLKPRKP